MLISCMHAALHLLLEVNIACATLGMHARMVMMLECFASDPVMHGLRGMGNTCEENGVSVHDRSHDDSQI
jgi:hypothetical protein